MRIFSNASRLGELARACRIRRALLAMIPSVMVSAGTALPYVIHHYEPQRIAVFDGADLKVTLIVVAVWALAWTAYAVSGRRRH